MLIVINLYGIILNGNPNVSLFASNRGKFCLEAFDLVGPLLWISNRHYKICFRLEIMVNQSPC